MRIKYSAMNQLQHSILNGPLNALGASPDENNHAHWCTDCGHSWTHQEPACAEPENVTSICPSCECEAYANEADEDQKYVHDHYFYWMG